MPFNFRLPNGMGEFQDVQMAFEVVRALHMLRSIISPGGSYKLLLQSKFLKKKWLHFNGPY